MTFEYQTISYDDDGNYWKHTIVSTMEDCTINYEITETEQIGFEEFNDWVNKALDETEKI